MSVELGVSQEALVSYKLPLFISLASVKLKSLIRAKSSVTFIVHLVCSKGFNFPLLDHDTRIWMHPNGRFVL